MLTNSRKRAREIYHEQSSLLRRPCVDPDRSWYKNPCTWITLALAFALVSGGAGWGIAMSAQKDCPDIFDQPTANAMGSEQRNGSDMFEEAINANEHQSGSDKLEEAFNANVDRNKNFRCHLPVPRSVDVWDLGFQMPTDEAVEPNVTILHRCGEHTGCCENRKEHCSYYKQEKVKRVFKIINKISNNSTFKEMEVYNHTLCKCVDESIK